MNNGTASKENCPEGSAIQDATRATTAEIGGSDMRVLDCGERDGKKRGQIVFGPEASKRINEGALEIRVLFKIAAYKAKADTMAIEEAA